MSEEEITVTVRATNGDKHSVRTKTSASVGALKSTIEAASGVKAEQQRLIYSGKVLKDSDVLADVGVKDGVSIHLVKGAAKPAAAAAASSPSPNNSAPGSAAAPPPAQQPAAANPFAGLFGAMPPPGAFGGAGAGGGGFPGLPPGVDLQQAFAMMQNPAVQQMMQQMMQNPQMLQAMMQANPMLQQMAANNPALQNPAFLNSLFAGGGGVPGGAAGQPPAGMPDIAALLQGMGGAPPAGAPGGMDLGALMAALGGGGGAMGGGIGVPGAPVLPPEERFATQLAQLGEMGFVERDPCIAALLATNGNVPAAVERLLNGMR